MCVQLPGGFSARRLYFHPVTFAGTGQAYDMTLPEA